MLATLQESDLIRLGVSTIGDRMRLQDYCRRHHVVAVVGGAVSTTSFLPTTENEMNSYTASSSRTNVSERASLFAYGRRRGIASSTLRGIRRGSYTRQSGFVNNAGTKKGRTWTINFMCLANRFALQLPSTLERMKLQNAGLGFKKVQVYLSDNEEDVLKKITQAFPPTKDCGGIELLSCVANSKDLVVLGCTLAVQDIRRAVGGSQGRIYIRPIQKSLSTESVVEEKPSTLKETCLQCGGKFLLKELRNHVRECIKDQDSSSSDFDEDIFDIPVFISPNNGEDQEEQLSPPPTSSVLSVSTSTTSMITSSVASSETSATYTMTYISHTSVDTLPTTDTNVRTPFTDLTTSNGNILCESSQDAMELKVKEILEYCKEKNLSQNTIEVLRHMQKTLIVGRALEITDLSSCPEGDTCFILVSRSDILNTGFEELLGTEERFKTLEVQFYNEDAKDYGGPRKEFFELIIRKIKEKYFDNGLLELCPEDYYAVGLAFGFSILQNGKIPTFIGEEGLDQIFSKDPPSSPCFNEIQKAFKEFGIYQMVKLLPIFRHLFHPSSCKALTLKRLINLLEPAFAVEGSNEFQFQSKSYSKFIKYAREASSGRRTNVSLEKILKFVTGSEEEPILGFELKPSIIFVEAMNQNEFLPTASTCSNQLQLRRGSPEIPLPDETDLFNYYDYAFSNEFFGVV